MASPRDTQVIEVTILVEVTPGDKADGRYDGDTDPDAVRAWMIPWLSSYVSFYAPHGVVAVNTDGDVIATS